MAGEILTQLNRIDSNIDAAFEKCRELGATMPSTINSDYLADTIETIPSSADIPVKTAADMTVSGATVTAPAGWYKQAASKAVPTATQATPSIEVNSSGLITAKTTQSAGYVAAGTKSGTKQLTTQAAKTVTPTTSEQTAVAAGVYTTGAVKVAKIPDSYIQPSGTKSITENGTHDVTSYASVDVNVPTSGGGGGGAVETCTVEITDFGDGLPMYAATTVVQNGVEVAYDNLCDIDEAFKSGALAPPYTISNVKCGALIVLYTSEAFSPTPYVEVYGGAVFIKASRVAYSRSNTGDSLMYIFTAPETPGAHATIMASFA